MGVEEERYIFQKPVKEQEMSAEQVHVHEKGVRGLRSPADRGELCLEEKQLHQGAGFKVETMSP